MTENQDIDSGHNLFVVLQNLGSNEAIGKLQRLGVVIHGLVKPIKPFIPVMARVSQAITPILQTVSPYIKRVGRYYEFIYSVRATGWLPYHTLPFHYVEDCRDDVSLLETRITDFYAENWQDIQGDIESRLDLYRISEETKEAFRESLSTHAAGSYRSVCSLLFPVIEWEFRIYFFEGRAGPISSKKMLEKLKQRSKARDILPREAYGWVLFHQLVHHLYESVNESNREKYEADDVPNRHACIHGIVKYTTFKHSLNMIIMADYIFQVLTSVSESMSTKKRPTYLAAVPEHANRSDNQDLH